MTDRVRRGRPAGRQGAVRLRDQRGAARHRHRPRHLLVGRRQGRRRSDAAEPGPAGPPRRPAGPDRQVAPAARHRAARSGGLQGLPHRDRLPASPNPPTSPSPPSGVDPEITSTAGPQLVVPVLNARFALNAVQRALGLAVRRAVRHRRHPGDRRRREGRQLQPGARRQGHRLRARHSSTRRPRWRRDRGPTPPASSVDDGAAADRHSATASRPGWPAPRQFAGYTGELGSPQWSVLLVNHGLHIEILIDPDSPDRLDRRGRRQGRRAGVGDHHDHGLRGLGGRRRRRRQGARLPQLAGPEPGRPVRRGQQGRQDRSPGCSTPTAPTPRPTAAS